MPRGRGGDRTGMFAAAASGRRDEAYRPPQSAQTSILSTLTGGRQQNGQQHEEGRSGPKSVDRQDYSNMPPPPDLNNSHAGRGRGRGARGALGFADRGQARGRGGSFRGQGHQLGQTNGAPSSSMSGEPAASAEATTNGQGPATGRGGFRGRARGGNPRGQSSRGASKPATSGPAPAPVL